MLAFTKLFRVAIKLEVNFSRVITSMVPLGPLVGAHLVPLLHFSYCLGLGIKNAAKPVAGCLSLSKSKKQSQKPPRNLGCEDYSGGFVRCFCTNQTWGGMTRGPQKHRKSKHCENFRRYYWKGLHSFEPDFFCWWLPCLTHGFSGHPKVLLP